MSIEFFLFVCYNLKERVMIMKKNFIRAKSQENKNIRIQQIMDTTDKLFYEKTYHEITLTMIAKEMNLARGGLYKYVTSKEEIFAVL